MVKFPPGSSSPESGVFSPAVLDSVSEIAIAMLAPVMRQEFADFPTEILATRPWLTVCTAYSRSK